MRRTAKGLEYPNEFYWQLLINPNATIQNGLANCTTFVYGAIKEDGHLPPVVQIVNANKWHENLTNGWLSKPYDYNIVECGDVIEWASKCHVAVVSDEQKNISGSYYTGMHGKAYYNGKFDSREFSNLEDMSHWMIANYPKRFFHYWSIEEENEWVGGKPDYILKHPLYSHEQDATRDQIEVLTFKQNVRNSANEVLCYAEKGYFNVLNTKENNGYLWYEVEDNKWIAQVDGRVIFREGQNSDTAELKKQIKELKSQNKILEDKLKDIKDICNR